MSIRGTVATVNGKSFTLRDRAGRTINVEHNNLLKLSEGDEVQVKGKISGKAFGFGEEIKANNVTRLSRR